MRRSVGLRRAFPKDAARRQEVTNHDPHQRISHHRRNHSFGQTSNTWGKNASTLFFAAVLIVCSVTVGCSSDKPKPVSSNNQIPVTQPESPLPTAPAPAVQATAKPAPRKVVHKRPATVNYTDKTYGVTFEYPRRYAIETGNAATELLASNPMP